MRYYLVAGEPSGDLHGANLMAAIKNKDPEAEFRFWGGDLMLQQGGELVRHYKETAIMGLIPVILNIRTIAKNMADCNKDIINYKPDVLILIDYPGFNLKIAKAAKAASIPVYYYIAPKVWATREGRVKKIKAYVDELFTIFPFETDFFNKHGIATHYVGNPLFDEIERKKDEIISDEELRTKYNLSEKPIITLLAGSRKQEIKHMLPIMLHASEAFPTYQFIIGGAPSQTEEFYAEVIGNYNAKVIFNETYSLLKHSTAALVTSGTATLETALIGTPQVVCYKTGGGKLAALILKKMLKVPFVSLVNLIVGHMAVKELLMYFLTAENVKKELDWILNNKRYRDLILEYYSDVNTILGGAGASTKAANKMVELLLKRRG